MNKVAGRDFNVIKGRPPQASDHRPSTAGSSAATGASTTTTTWSRGARGRLALRPLRSTTSTAERWELRDMLYVARARLERRVVRPRARLAAHVPAGSRRSATIPQARTREIEPPSYFGQEERPADTLRFGELRRHIASLELLGLDVTPLRVQLHRKLAFPVVCVVMTLLGIPFAFVVARRGALYGHRRQRRDRDRLLGLPGHLRRAGQQRACCRRCWRPGRPTCCSAAAPST